MLVSVTTAEAGALPGGERVVSKGLSAEGAFKLRSEGKGSSHVTPSGECVQGRGSRKYRGPERGSLAGAGNGRRASGAGHSKGRGVTRKEAASAGRGQIARCLLGQGKEYGPHPKGNKEPWVSFQQKSNTTSLPIIRIDKKPTFYCCKGL